MAVRTILIRATRNESVSTVVINRGPAGADGTGGTSTIAEAGDVATVDLPTLNGPLGTALDGKAPLSHTHTVSDITDFPTLATVATSGAYADLTGTPTLVVNFGDLGDATTVDLPTVNTPLGTALGLKLENGDSPSFGDVTAAGGTYKTGEDIQFFTIRNGNSETFPVAVTSWHYGATVRGQISTVSQGLRIRGNSQIIFTADLAEVARINSTGLDVVGNIEASGTVQPGIYTVSTLPGGVAGMRATVSDSDKHAQGNFGNTVVAAGAGTPYVVPVFFDGTNWIIA